MKILKNLVKGSTAKLVMYFLIITIFLMINSNTQFI